MIKACFLPSGRNILGCDDRDGEGLRVVGMSFALHERALKERNLFALWQRSVVFGCLLQESQKKDYMVSATRNNQGVLINSIYAVMIGICGSILLSVFLADLLTLEAALKTIPWIVGFNAALSGFNLVEKTGARVAARRYGCLAGLVVGFAAYTILNSLAFYAIGVPVLTAKDLVILLLVGTACGGFGFLLARKYRDLK